MKAFLEKSWLSMDQTPFHKKFGLQLKLGPPTMDFFKKSRLYLVNKHLQIR
jgi:hypothetical protein